MNNNQIWLNGQYINSEDAKIPIGTHTLHYGSGAFEGMRVYKTDQGPAVFRLEDHLNRLIFSGETIGMECPYPKSEIKKICKELIKINEIEEGYLRPILFYSPKMGLQPDNLKTNLAIMVVKWDAYLGTKPVKVKISSFIRPHPKSTVMEAKICGMYANSVLASIDAKKYGCNEALLLDYQGNVAEGPGENIFFILGKKLITPKKNNILAGITRNTVISFANDLGFTVEEKDIDLQAILKFDEAFFTGTAAEITLIEQIDKRYFQLKKGQQIQKYYGNIVHGEIDKYKHLLTFIND